MSRIKNLSRFKPLNFFNAKDGKQIKNNLLFRSGDLSKLKEKQMKILRDRYHIGTVIDFRSKPEIEEKPDARIEGIDYINIPLLPNDFVKVVTKENRMDIFKDILKQDGGSEQEMIEYYQKVVSSKESIEGYRKAFEVLLNNEERKPILFHCTQGKDRTGLFACMVLYALGCSKRTVFRSYLSFNDYNRVKSKFLACVVAVRCMSIKKAREFENIMSVKPLYFAAAVNQVIKDFGSINQYYLEVLNLTPDKIKKLKELYYRKKTNIFF